MQQGIPRPSPLGEGLGVRPVVGLAWFFVAFACLVVDVYLSNKV